MLVHVIMSCGIARLATNIDNEDLSLITIDRLGKTRAIPVYVNYRIDD